jgi:hypothetical protein
MNVSVAGMMIRTTLGMRFSTLGVTSITINSPVSGGTASYYIIAPGYKGQVTY